MIKNVIFDWSGVIKDAVESHLWVINRMFEKFGANQISMEEFKNNWEQPYMVFYNKYLPNLTFEEEQKAYKEIVLHEDCPSSKPYPEIVDFIKKLKQKGFFIAIISSDLPETIFTEIKKYSLEGIFDKVIVNIENKTNALKNLVKEKNLNLQKTFFIGDSNHEIESGKEAKIKSIAVTWGFSTEDKLKSAEPDYIVHNLKELEDIILKHD